MRYRRSNRDLYLPPIKGDIFTDGQKYLFVDSYGVLPVSNIQKASIRNRVLKVILNENYTINSEKTKWFTLKYNYYEYNQNDMYNALENTLIKIAKPSGSLGGFPCGISVICAKQSPAKARLSVSKKSCFIPSP